MIHQYRFNPFTRKHEVIEYIPEIEHLAVVGSFETKQDAERFIIRKEREITKLFKKALERVT